MRKWEEFTPLQKTTSSNRAFAATFALFFFLVALFSGQYILFFSLTVLFTIIGFFYPKLLYYPNRAWYRLGILLQKITNPLIAGIIFYLIITPYALLLRLFRKELLKLDCKSSSYWHKSKSPSPNNMEHPF